MTELSTAVTTPKRIKRSRQNGWRRPENCVIVDRTSRYGNPHRVVKQSSGTWLVQFPSTAVTFRTEAAAREASVRLFVRDTLPKLDLTPLRGKDLACFCDPADGMACHATPLLAAANA